MITNILGFKNMKENRIVPPRDLVVSEACEKERISELRKWSSHFAFRFPQNPRSGLDEDETSKE